VSLTLAALSRRRPSAERGALLDQIRDNQRALGLWARHGPANFRHKHLLVEAELARCEARPIAEVLPLYEEAIALAAHEGFVHEQALANELAGRAHLASGRLTTAVRCLQAALGGYAAWGAAAKVASLEAEFPDLVAASTLANRGAAPDLDLLSILKAAAAISSELDLDRLLEKLIHVCAEAAGAERGILVLEEAGQAFVRAAGVVGQPVELSRTPLGESHELPRTIIEHVRAHKLSLVLDHAARDPRFASDPYVERHAVKSVLAAPLMRQAMLIGTLYFENNLVTGAFTPRPVKVLDLLTAQVATSLEISQLVERLTREIQERARAEAEVRFLADASSTFAESLDYEATLARVAQQVVPFLADWCFVDLVDEQHQIRRVASAHADGSREIFERLYRRGPLNWTPPEPWLRVLRTGEPLVLSRITEDTFAEYSRDENVRRLFRALDPKSGLAVPLLARGRILGAISLGSRTPEAFGSRELRIAQELARRAAIAIENARLYADARRAIEVRDEFISVASHELYTPITSMNLAIQGIQSGVLPRTPQALDHVFAVTARQIRRLTRLIDELLNVSRIDAGRLQLDLEPIDLAQVVREIVQRFEEDLASSGSSVAIRAEAPVIGRWDNLGLEQVIVNLLSNAIKFGTGKPIEITVECDATLARLVVRDHGTGIAPDRVPHIFERFERGVTTRQYGGLGLGLYIVKGIVDAFGGVIHVESKLDEGSIFTVELPLAGRPTKASPERPAEVAQQGA
jgi:signal transduction histidine kinase